MSDVDAWPSREADEQRYRELSDALADAVEAAIPGWVERCVADRLRQLTGSVPDDVAADARAAGEAARAEIGARIRKVLAGEQGDTMVNPLHLLRSAVSYPTEVLAAAAVPDVLRDPFAVQHFPADVYDLSPATWGDVDESLQEIGLTWSAATAYLFKARRRLDGHR